MLQRCIALKIGRCESSRVTSPLGSKSKLQSLHDYIVSRFPEETWAQRKPNQIQKNDQKASE